MTEARSPSDLQGTVDLAATPDFALGALRISPATREVRGDGEPVTAEPRALQVLIALAQAQGRVVSRDALLQRCWDGRVRGEDAVNRAIAKARGLAELTRAARLHHQDRAARGAPPAPGRRRGPGRDRGSEDATEAGGLNRAGGDREPGSLVDLPAPRRAGGHRGRGAGRADAPSCALAAVVRDEVESALAAEQPLEARGASARAALVVRGRAEADGGRARVALRLETGRGGQLLWSGAFQGDPHLGGSCPPQAVAKVTDLARLAARLLSAIGPGASPDVRRSYVLGFDAVREHRPLEAREAFRGLKMRLPKLSLAHPTYAMATLQAAREQSKETSVAWLREAGEEARLARRLDPRNPKAWLALALLAPPGDFATRQRLLREALRIDPDDATLNSYLGGLLVNVGRPREGLAHARRARALDPFRPTTAEAKPPAWPRPASSQAPKEQIANRNERCTDAVSGPPARAIPLPPAPPGRRRESWQREALR